MSMTLETRQSQVNLEYNTLRGRAAAGDGVLNEHTGAAAACAAAAINEMNEALSEESASKASIAVAELRRRLNGAGATPATPAPTAPPAPTPDPGATTVTPPPTPPTGNGPLTREGLVDVLNDASLPLNQALVAHRNQLDDHESRIAALENHGGITTIVISLAVGLAIVASLIGWAAQALLGGIVVGVLLFVGVLFIAALRKPTATTATPSPAPATSN